MVKDLTKDEAQLRRAVGETWYMVKGSHFGKRLLAELDKIEAQAIKGNLQGETPTDYNGMMERRGDYRTVQRIRNVFVDIERENEAAIEWMALNNPSDDASVK